MVSLSGSTVAGNIYGGRAITGAADNNLAVITAGQDVYGGRSLDGSAADNTALATAGSISGLLAGGAGTTAVNGNLVQVSDSAVVAGNTVAGLGRPGYHGRQQHCLGIWRNGQQPFRSAGQWSGCRQYCFGQRWNG